MIGETIGSFRLVSRLGGGGMGDVYLAEQAAIDTKVAIKLLKPDISRDTDQVQRFFNEARAVGKIKHAGTVKIFEGGFHASGHAYLIMEYLEGETLAARLARVGRLPLGIACELGRQMASVLAATHAVGITHRDLKPDNILIVADAELASGERVKILDFGIAKLTGTMASGPGTVGTMGTPSYMAPEQWGNSANADWRTDAYALGCVLFEMTCGRPPFLGASFADLCAAHLSAVPPSPRSITPALPAGFEALVLRLLAKAPGDRAQTIAEVGRELEAIARTTSDGPAAASGSMPHAHSAAAMAATLAPTMAPSTTTLGGAAAEIARSPRARARAAPWIAAGILVAAAGAATIAIARHGDDTPPRPEPVAAKASEPPAAIDVPIAVAHHAAPSATAAPQPQPPAAPTTQDPIRILTTSDAIALAGVLVDSTDENPFVDIHGVTMQRHQVTYRELAAEPGGPEPLVWNRKAAGPSPAVWMTWDAARAYCRARNADLPTSEQWQRAAAGRWGIDDGAGKLGPLQEWTATLDNGLAIVRGGHAWMTKDQLAEAVTAPMLKATLATAGPSPSNATVAGDKIGFRCAR